MAGGWVALQVVFLPYVMDVLSDPSNLQNDFHPDARARLCFYLFLFRGGCVCGGRAKTVVAFFFRDCCMCNRVNDI